MGLLAACRKPASLLGGGTFCIPACHSGTLLDAWRIQEEVPGTGRAGNIALQAAPPFSTACSALPLQEEYATPHIYRHDACHFLTRISWADTSACCAISAGT